MKHSEIKPHLTYEAFSAFVDIADWLEAGGKANKKIPFGYDWHDASCCVGGALQYLVDYPGYRSGECILVTGIEQGMTKDEAISFFTSGHLGESSLAKVQSPTHMAKVIRNWLYTGKIKWIDTARMSGFWPWTRNTCA